MVYINIVAKKGAPVEARVLQEIGAKIKASAHALQRMEERGGSMQELREAVKHPFLAYYGNNNEITIAPNRRGDYIVKRDPNGAYYLITYVNDNALKRYDGTIKGKYHGK